MKNHRLNTFNLNSILSSPPFLWAISITASIIMWLYVTGIDETSYITSKITCPLEYRGLDAQTLLRNRLSEVDVEIKAPESIMLRLDYSQIRPYIDARNLPIGKRYTVNINVDRPNGVIISSVYPSQTTLDTARQVTRLMTVEATIPQTADLPQGYYIDNVQITPKDVGIKGAEDDVAKIGSVRVTPTLEELQSGREVLLPVKLSQSEPFEGGVVIEPAQVRFSALLVSGLPRKRVPVNARLIGDLGMDYEVRSVVVDPPEVVLEGTAEALSKIDAVDTVAIDITGFDGNRDVVVPLVDSEVAGVEFRGVSSVNVNISLSPAHVTRTVSDVPIEIRGTNVPEKWAVHPDRASITLEGLPSILGGLSSEIQGIVRAYVDLSDIYMTTLSLPVRAEIVSDDYALRIQRTAPIAVTVTHYE